MPAGEESIARTSTTLPMALGRLGLRSPAFRSSWADTLPMTRRRHSEVAEVIVHHLERGGTSPCLGSARRAAVVLDGVDGFQVPSWSAVASGLRPPIIGDEDREPGVPGQGWQHAAASCVEADIRAATLMPRMNPAERALFRSQSGPCAGVPFTTCPSSPLTRIDSALFRVLLQRRLHLRVWPATRPFWPSPRSMFEELWGGRVSIGECDRPDLQGSRRQLSPTCW